MPFACRGMPFVWQRVALCAMHQHLAAWNAFLCFARRLSLWATRCLHFIWLMQNKSWMNSASCWGLHVVCWLSQPELLDVCVTVGHVPWKTRRWANVVLVADWPTFFSWNKTLLMFNLFSLAPSKQFPGCFVKSTASPKRSKRAKLRKGIGNSEGA